MVLGWWCWLLRALRFCSIVLFIIAVPVALITTNVRFAVNQPRVYRYAIDDFGAVRATGIDRDQLLRASGELRDYFNSGNEPLAIQVQVNARDQSLFNPRETAHLADVKDRFQLVNRAQELSFVYILIFIAAAVVWARAVSARSLAVYVAAGCGICLAVIATIGLLGLAGFDSAWEDFHLLIFSNDFWRLNPATDHLIQIFPLAFWENIVFILGLMIAGEAALLLLASGFYLGASKRAGARRLTADYA
jgi:integral membrane protein (TIGR01906 family)